MASQSGSFEEMVAPLLAELLASANAHDTDRHCAVYARDAALVFVANGDITRGWDAYRERQRQWWNAGRATGVYEYSGAPVCQPLGENFGVTTLIILARNPLPEGGLRERELVFTALWSRRPEGWRIIHAHESSAT